MIRYKYEILKAIAHTDTTIGSQQVLNRHRLLSGDFLKFASVGSGTLLFATITLDAPYSILHYLLPSRVNSGLVVKFNVRVVGEDFQEQMVVFDDAKVFLPIVMTCRKTSEWDSIIA